VKEFMTAKHTPSLLLKFTLLAIFATAGATSPLRIVAQEPEKAAATEGKAEQKPSQEEQNEKFLTDGAAVKWLAHTLNVEPKVASNIFVWTNFGIIFLAIGIPLSRTLPKIMRQRSLNVSSGIAEARKATEEAQTRLSAIEAKLSGLGTEIAAIREQMERESQSDETRIKASIEDEKARIIASAEQEINVAATHARRSIEHLAVNLAIEQAAKQLILTPESDKALIAEFIDGVKGGQN